MRHTLSGFDINRLAVSACIDPSTVRRFLRGEKVQRSTVTLLSRAAQDLGIALPGLREAAAA